jgi:hypothetical protein
MTEFFRQGDVLLEKIEVADNCLVEESKTIIDAKIIAHGEKTGHSHFFDESINNSSQVLLYKEINEQNPTMVIIKDETALLKHQDHLHIRIPRGRYIIKRERSYNPFISQKQMKIQMSND